jgi:soluble lytic murein transglycosylase-like protein
MSIVDQIAAEAQRQGVDPSLAIEVARRESSLNPDAPDGAAGEIGLFQLMPRTAAALGVNPRDPAQNIQGGISLLRQLVSKYGDPGAALGAYNMGETKFDPIYSQWGPAWFSHIPGSTQGYVNDILGNMAQYQAKFTPAPAAPTFVTGSVLNIPTAPAAMVADSAGSIWSTLAVAAAIILGLGFVLSES